MNFENQYAFHGLFKILKIKAQDYPLKCCIVEQKWTIHISGSSMEIGKKAEPSVTLLFRKSLKGKR
jgi:hypothetical protein